MVGLSRRNWRDEVNIITLEQTTRKPFQVWCGQKKMQVEHIQVLGLDGKMYTLEPEDIVKILDSKKEDST